MIAAGVRTARATPVAGALVILAVRMLPREHRDRYEDEFRADLCLLPWRRQIPQATGLVVGAASLRGALKERETSVEMKST